MKFIDNFLDNITMYGLLLYGLLILAVISIVLSLFGLVVFSPLSLIGALLPLILVAGLVNYLLGWVFKVPLNQESSHISALILFFALTPLLDLHSFYLLVLAATLAMVSKYLLNTGGRHLFNPAAISLVILDISGLGGTAWWISVPVLVIPVIILGFLVVKKIRKFHLFNAFALTSLIVFLITRWSGGSLLSNLEQAILYSPLIFFGSIMVTEPLTMPPTKISRIIYGIIIGLLFSLSYRLGPIYSTPELALIIGNVFSYFVSFKSRVRLAFVESQTISSHTFNITLEPERPFQYKAGQYMEWTLPDVSFNKKGNRRYFTIASSPTESKIHLGISYDPAWPSRFKEKLLKLGKGDSLFAHGVAGDFVLPDNSDQKMVFIAGGIGITPFRSMIKYLSDKGEKRPITLFYSVHTSSELAYEDVFGPAEQAVGLKRKEVPDYRERLFYLSGPPKMVEAFKKILTEMGVSRSQIKTDFFIGYA